MNSSSNLASGGIAKSTSSTADIGTSSTDLKPSKSIRELGSSLVRKMSRPSRTFPGNEGGRSELVVDPSSEGGTGAREVQRAVMSAAAVCNGRPGTDPALLCYEELLKLFLCTGCLAMMRPPFPQCRKGHLVCADCKQNTKNVCPICKQRFAEYTNVMMEQVYQLLKLPCRFAVHGCPILSSVPLKAAHEADCSHRPVACKYEGRGCLAVLPYHDMHAHVTKCSYAP